MRNAPSIPKRKSSSSKPVAYYENCREGLGHQFAVEVYSVVERIAIDMLYYHREKFVSESGILSDLSHEVVLYASSLAQNGFIARKTHAVSQHRASGIVDFGAILCHPTAIDDAAALDKFKEYRRAIEDMTIAPPVVEVHEVAYSDDHHYCLHDQWRSLRIQDSGYAEISPLVCNDCNGIVATYRLNLTGEAASLLWDWDVQYRLIEPCWILSAEYESWAAQEIFDPASKLNELGVKAATAIAQQLHCEVVYVLPSEEGVTHRVCPTCGGPLQKVNVAWRNALCPRCRIVTMQPD